MSVGLSSPLLAGRSAELDRLLAAEGGLRKLSLRRRPPADIDRIGLFLDDRANHREEVERYAGRWGLPLLLLRRGPFGPLLLAPGSGQLPLLSLMVGPAQPRDLKTALHAVAAQPDRRTEATAMITGLRRHRLGLDNCRPLPASAGADGGRPLVLVLDEPAPWPMLLAMLDAAQADHPGAEVRILPLPGLEGEARHGALCRLAASRGLAIDQWAGPSGWQLARACHVYVQAHPLGLDALIQGVPVTCFGFPPYAGWGLTDDRRAPPQEMPATLPDLVAALLHFCRFASPYDGGEADLDLLLRHGIAVLARERRATGDIVLVEANPLRRAALRPFLESRGSRLRSAVSVKAGARRLIGLSRGTLAVSPPDAEAARASGHRVLLLDDGPAARLGLTDPCPVPGLMIGDPADLAMDLASADLDPASQAEAVRLIDRLRLAASASEAATSAAPARIRLLVPVEPDLAPAERRRLLAAARAAHPDAWIIQAGPAAAAEPDTGADRLTAPIPAGPLQGVDRLFVRESALGLIGLMQGLPVETIGDAFYAGWGLTVDHRPPTRPRALSLVELVAGCLLVCPAFIDPGSGLPCDFRTAQAATVRAKTEKSPISARRWRLFRRRN